MKPKEPSIPSDRQETIRQKIISALKKQTLSAKDLSALVSIREKEVSEHLFHIQKTIQKERSKLIIMPAECKKCGFTFKKRERFKKPGKCPVCRHEAISEPLFLIQ